MARRPNRRENPKSRGEEEEKVGEEKVGDAANDGGLTHVIAVPGTCDCVFPHSEERVSGTQDSIQVIAP